MTEFLIISESANGAVLAEYKISANSAKEAHKIAWQKNCDAGIHDSVSSMEIVEEFI